MARQNALELCNQSHKQLLNNYEAKTNYIKDRPKYRCSSTNCQPPHRTVNLSLKRVQSQQSSDKSSSAAAAQSPAYYGHLNAIQSDVTFTLSTHN